MFDTKPIDKGLELTNETVLVTVTQILDVGTKRLANVEFAQKESRAVIIAEQRLDLLDARAQRQLLAELTAAAPGPNWDQMLAEVVQAAKREGAENAMSEPPEPVWEAPLPFQNHVIMPLFPSNVLPPALKAYALGLAEATQTPVDLTALLSLAVCASAIARKVQICVRPGYLEPTNVFIVVVLPPGSRKSAVFAEVLKPLEAFERAENERLAPQIAKDESEYRMTEKMLAQAEAQAVKETKSNERELLKDKAKVLAEEFSRMKPIYPPQLVADDVTPERIGSLLYEQGGRLSLMSPEGGDVFDMMAGRYSGNRSPNFGVFLRAHAGDTLRVGRVGRKAEYVERPALTLGLTAQPEVLLGLITQPGFKGRGLLGRFLYAIPNSRMGSRRTGPPPLSDNLQNAYHELVTALMKIDYGRDKSNEPVAHTLRLAPDAIAAIDAFEQRIEPQLGPFGAMAHMSDWGGKVVGAAARLAAILHMVKHVGASDLWNILVSKETIDAAIQLADYLIPHAKTAYGQMDSDPLLANAKYLLDWIHSETRESFSKRDAHRGTAGRFKKVADLEPALQLLIDYDYIRPQSEEKRPGPGRQPSPTFIVNPLTDRIDTIDTIPPLGEELPNSVNCVNSVIRNPENFSAPDAGEIEEDF
jgi:replicative DNA helicase